MQVAAAQVGGNQFCAAPYKCGVIFSKLISLAA